MTWPDKHRLCLACKEIKSYSEFHKHKKCFDGINSICKKCRVPLSKSRWTSKDLGKKIFDRAKSRATRKGLEFTIELEDIVIPEICPVFKKKIQIPSIDRINSDKGYIKGNIRIIENRANVLKNNASSDELILVLEDLLRL